MSTGRCFCFSRVCSWCVLAFVLILWHFNNLFLGSDTSHYVDTGHHYWMWLIFRKLPGVFLVVWCRGLGWIWGWRAGLALLGEVRGPRGGDGHKLELNRTGVTVSRGSDTCLCTNDMPVRCRPCTAFTCRQDNNMFYIIIYISHIINVVNIFTTWQTSLRLNINALMPPCLIPTDLLV